MYNYRFSDRYAGRRAYRPAYRAPAPVTVDFTDARWVSFKEVQPTIAAWIEAKADSFDFAASLFGAIMRHGDLTANQYDAVERCIQRDKARAVPAPQGNNTVDQSAIRVVLANRKKVTVAGFTFSVAGPGSRNHLAIYVKDAGVYIGKVLLGGTEFIAGRDFDPARMDALRAVFANPGEAARADAAERSARILEAARNGDSDIEVPCGCCGILLTDPVSRARGIGPICAGKWGF